MILKVNTHVNVSTYSSLLTSSTVAISLFLHKFSTFFSHLRSSLFDSYFYARPVGWRLRCKGTWSSESGPPPFLPDRLAFQWSRNTHTRVFLLWIFSLRAQIYESNSILSLIARTRRYSWCSAPTPAEVRHLSSLRIPAHTLSYQVLFSPTLIRDFLVHQDCSRSQ